MPDEQARQADLYKLRQRPVTNHLTFSIGKRKIIQTGGCHFKRCTPVGGI